MQLSNGIVFIMILYNNESLLQKVILVKRGLYDLLSNFSPNKYLVEEESIIFNKFFCR